MKLLPITLLLLIATPCMMVAQQAADLDPRAVEETDLEQLDEETQEAPALRYQDAVNILREELVVESDETALIRSLAVEEFRNALKMNDELAWRNELLQSRLDMIASMNKELTEQNRLLLEENESLTRKDSFINEEEEEQITSNLAMITLNEKQIEDNLRAADETEQLMAELELQLDENEARTAAAEDLMEDCDMLLSDFALSVE